MAASKWLDPIDTNFTDWTDEDQTVLISHLWGTLKGAADERHAFVDESHSESDLPPLTEDNMAIVFSEGSPNIATKITNAIFPLACVDEDSIETSGIASSDADIPENYTLSTLLTNELSYPSGTLLHMTDSNNGTRPALFRYAWIKQWYQVMYYPKYFNFNLDGRTSYMPNRWSLIEMQSIEVECEYSYDPVSLTFNYCNLVINGGANLYVTNDLSESSPFSTPSDVRSYIANAFDGALTTVSWNNVKNSSSVGGGSTADLGAQLTNDVTYFKSGSDEIYIYNLILGNRIRFKMADDFYPTSPNKFTSDIYWNGFFRSGGDIFSGNGSPTNTTFAAFDTGKIEKTIEFTKLSPDGSGYYYLVDLPSFDMTTVAPPSLPADPTPETSATNKAGASHILNSLTTTMGTYTNTLHSLYSRPNITDGTGFAYYTPAP